MALVSFSNSLNSLLSIRSKENISVGTWNVRTLRPAGKLELLTQAMDRYHWNIVGLVGYLGRERRRETAVAHQRFS